MVLRNVQSNLRFGCLLRTFLVLPGRSTKALPFGDRCRRLLRVRDVQESPRAERKLPALLVLYDGKQTPRGKCCVYRDESESLVLPE